MGRATSLKPVRKVQAGSATAAVTILLVWVLDRFAGIEIPAYVASAFTTILAFAAAYAIPSGPESSN